MRAAKRALLAGPPLAACALILSSCVQALGIKDLPGTCGDATYAKRDCATCMSAQCCDEVSACATDPACSAEMSCLDACQPSDPACRAACGATLRSPSTLRGAVEACRRESCRADCLGCDVYGSSLGADCGACAVKAACNEAATCASRPASDAYLACIFGCADPVCVDDCHGDLSASEFKAAFALEGAMAGCRSCGVGRDWSCQGSYAIPPPSKQQATVRLLLTDLNGHPWDGLSVRACSNLTCPETLDSATSANGVAEVTVSLNPISSGFGGILEIQSAAEPVLPAISAVDGLRGSVTFPVTMFRTAEVQLGLVYVGEHFEPSLDAVVVLLAFDCHGFLAPEIAFELDPPYDAAKVSYVEVDKLSRTAKATFLTGDAIAVLHTNGSLPADYVSFKARLTTTGKVVGSGTIPVRLGWVSLADHIFHIAPPN